MRVSIWGPLSEEEPVNPNEMRAEQEGGQPLARGSRRQGQYQANAHRAATKKRDYEGQKKRA